MNVFEGACAYANEQDAYRVIIVFNDGEVIEPTDVREWFNDGLSLVASSGEGILMYVPFSTISTLTILPE